MRLPHIGKQHNSLSENGVMTLLSELSAMATYDANHGVSIDLGGVVRFTTRGHPNLPDPPPQHGLIDFSTGLDGSGGSLGEINVAIADNVHRYLIEAHVSSPDLVAEVSDGTNPTQIIAPVIERPTPDEIWASFLTVRTQGNPLTQIRIYYKQSWGQQTPPDTSWILYKLRVWRIE
jgi:hypothetical protein